jgi:hypothetical protein
LLEPVGQGVAADVKDAADPAHGSAFLIGGEYLFLELLGVAAFVFLA